MKAGKDQERKRDRRNKQQRRRDARRDPVTGKSEYEKVISGEIEPQGCQKGWINLKPIPITEREPERRREICRKGAETVNRIHGEEKTAKESLNRMLSILATDEIIEQADIETALVDRLQRENPDMTIYDVVNAAAIGRALAGNVKSMEYIRDTRGDAPVKQIEVTENVTTDADREMMRQLSELLKEGGRLEVVKDIPSDSGTGEE